MLEDIKYPGDENAIMVQRQELSVTFMVAVAKVAILTMSAYAVSTFSINWRIEIGGVNPRLAAKKDKSP